MHPKYLHVEKYTNLIRDTRSSAILNVDNQALKKYRVQKEKILNEKNEINILKEEINKLKDMMSQILEKIK